MVNFSKIFMFTGLSQAISLPALQARDGPYGDATNIEYGLTILTSYTKNYTQDVRAYKGNSTNLDQDYYNLYYTIYNVGNGANGPHLTGPFSPSDAKKVCNYIKDSLAKANGKFLDAVVARKNRFVHFGYNSTFLDNLNNLKDTYETNLGYITGASRESDRAYSTCQNAAGTIDSQYSDAIAKFGN